MDSILQIIMILCCTTMVSGILKCYTCNNVDHEHICKENTTLAASDGQHVTDCKGTCIIGKLYNAKISVLRRECDDNYQIEISETLKSEDGVRGFKCHCKTDFCNINLRVCESPLPDGSTASTMSMQYINLCIVLNAIFTLLIFV